MLFAISVIPSRMSGDRNLHTQRVMNECLPSAESEWDVRDYPQWYDPLYVHIRWEWNWMKSDLYNVVNEFGAILVADILLLVFRIQKIFDKQLKFSYLEFYNVF